MKKAKICLLSLLALGTLASCNLGGDKPASGSSATSSVDIAALKASIKLPIEGLDVSKLYSAGANDNAVYDAVLGKYYDLITAAGEIVDDSTRWAAYARAEAELLDTSVMKPTTTDGGTYGLTHVAYRSGSYVKWGYDSDKLKNVCVVNDIITKKQRDDLEKLWNEALEADGTYDPVAYFAEDEITPMNKYTSTFNTLPETMDIHNTSRRSDTEYLVQGVDGLVEYDNLGRIKPLVASSWDVSDDGTKYTFHLRNDVKWYKADGTVYGTVKAQDFVDGFHHMLDSTAGLGDLVCGVVKNAEAYYYGETEDFAEVGIKAVDDTTLEIELEKEIPYFMSMLTYSTYAPMNGSFFQEKGGVYGRAALKEAKKGTAYVYGKGGDVTSVLYNGAFICKELTANSKILYEAAPGYYNADNTLIKTIEYLYNDGSNPEAYYNDFVQGKYVSCGLSNTLLQLAKNDGNYDECAFVSSTGTTSYFDAINLNRIAYDCVAYPGKGAGSDKTEDQKLLTKYAALSKNFRKAFNYALDKVTWNASTVDPDIAANSIRNMYTSPDFVTTTKAVTYDGVSFKAHTTYGDMVQAYLDKYYGGEINVADGQDGWFNANLARQYMDAAIEELGGRDVFNAYGGKIIIDIVNYANSPNMVKQATSYKSLIEQVLPEVEIKVRDADIYSYYYSGYYADYGSECNYDTFYGSGWGPDYGDPISYLNTFLPDGAGYMTKTLGLY